MRNPLDQQVPLVAELIKQLPGPVESGGRKVAEFPMDHDTGIRFPNFIYAIVDPWTPNMNFLAGIRQPPGNQVTVIAHAAVLRRILAGDEMANQISTWAFNQAEARL